MTDTTWKKHPADRDFSNAANWKPASVPGSGDTAFFGVSDTTTIRIPTNTAVNSTPIGGWTFKAAAPHYTLKLGHNIFLDFDGAGIVVNGGAVSIRNNADNGVVNFRNSSTAGRSSIDNVSGGLVQFNDSSHAGRSKIANDGGVIFNDSSSAEKAVITTLDGAQLRFQDHADAGQARISTKAGGSTIWTSDGPGHDGKISAGSIAGAGEYDLGGNVLTVGSNNRSTKVSGLIDDGGLGGGLVKVGTGTLTLSHANNSYSFGTVLSAGTLDIAVQGASGNAPTIDFDTLSTAKQTLKIENAAFSPLLLHAFGPGISGFGIGDVIDLPGLKFTKHAKASFDGVNTLAVKSGHVTDTLTLQNPDMGIFKVKNDGHGGTKVVLTPTMEKPLAGANVDSVTAPNQGEHHIARASFQFGNLAAVGGMDSERTESHNSDGSEAPVSQHDADFGSAFHLDFAGVMHGGADGHFFANTAADVFIV